MKNVLLFITLSTFLCLQAPNCFAIVIKVHAATNSIHKAINNAHNGDTLVIQQGLYKEHDITIQKRLLIIGEGFPIIDAESKYQVFIIRRDSVIIKGLQIRNIGTASISDMAGIKIINAK